MPTCEQPHTIEDNKYEKNKIY